MSSTVQPSCIGYDCDTAIIIASLFVVRFAPLIAGVVRSAVGRWQIALRCCTHPDSQYADCPYCSAWYVMTVSSVAAFAV